MTRLPQSNGTLGEQMAQVWFGQHGWAMFRHQPPTKVVRTKNGPIVIQCKSDGISDFTGYRTRFLNNYVACEAKEAAGDTMPCSRLDKDQREWLSNLPPGSATVAITWTDRDGPWCEVHPFRPKGSYKRGKGTR